MITGGVKPLRCKGKIVISVVDAGQNDFVERFIVSVFGWKRNYTTGQGSTPEKALADWCKNTSQKVETVLKECLFYSDISLPEGWEPAVW